MAINPIEDASAPCSPSHYGNSPRKTLRLKHVSAPRVSVFGGGAGNASAYADAVPKGGAAILTEVELGSCVHKRCLGLTKR